MKKFALTAVLLLAVSAMMVPQASAQFDPVIRTSQTLVDWGQVPVFAGYGITITVYNDGGLPLVIKRVYTDMPFAGFMPRMTIPPYSSAPLNLFFGPSAVGSVTEILSIDSNAINAPTYTITLTGEGI